jgi:hypothetical protein
MRMVVTRSKILAVVIAFGYITVAVVMSGWDTRGVFCIGLIVMVPLALIWFPDEISAYCSPNTRFYVGRGFDSPTPPFMVTLSGWVGLVGFLPLLAYLFSR